MKSNTHSILPIIILFSFFISSVTHAQCPIGDSTQSNNNGSLYVWGGNTASVVTVNQITTTLNNSNQPIVVSQTNATASPFQITESTCSLTEQAFQRWLKNSGYTSDGSNVGDYIAVVQLTFSNAVPANEIFIALTDIDARGVSSVEPDGFIRFNLSSTTSNATPANFQMVTLSSSDYPIMNPVTSYNADGSGGIDFGVTATDTAANRYLGLMSADTQTVKAINIFVRNISDDMGIYVGAVNANNVLSIGLTQFTGTNTANGNVLQWTISDESNLSEFMVERSVSGKNGTFTEIGNVSNSNLGKYQYADEQCPAGKTFYRLKMIERNGNYNYSSIISVENNRVFSEALVFPNPVTDNRFLIKNVSGVEEVKLYDYTGRCICDLNFTNDGNGCNVTINNTSLPKGLYIATYRYGTRLTGKTKLLVQ